MSVAGLRRFNSLHRLANILPSCSPGGIGHSLALTFHSHNLRVFATARNASSLTTLAAHGIETLPLTVDSEPSIQYLLDTLTPLLHGRGLDYLVNNAGINYTVPALDIDLPGVRDVFETNVFGVMRLCQVFAPLLIEAKGTIVMLGSLAGVIPYVFGSVYNASKAALHAYANTLRVEMAPLGVSVITVVTGGVKSRIARTSRVLPEDSLYAAVDEEYQGRLTHPKARSQRRRSVPISATNTLPFVHITPGRRAADLHLPQHLELVQVDRHQAVRTPFKLTNTRDKSGA